MIKEEIAGRSIALAACTIKRIIKLDTDKGYSPVDILLHIDRQCNLYMKGNEDYCQQFLSEVPPNEPF